MQTAIVWSCLPFIRSGQNHLARHSEWGKEVGSQQQGMDRFGVRQVPEGSGEQGKWRKLVVKSFVVPQQPSRLRDRWWCFVCFCLCGPFNCISFHKSSRQLSTFSLCYSCLNSAFLVLSTIFLFMKVPQPWYNNPLWLTRLKALANWLTVCPGEGDWRWHRGRGDCVGPEADGQGGAHQGGHWAALPQAHQGNQGFLGR